MMWLRGTHTQMARLQGITLPDHFVPGIDGPPPPLVSETTGLTIASYREETTYSSPLTRAL